MPRNLTWSVADSIATVSLDRPDKLNGLTLDTLDALVEAAQSIRRDRSIRAVVVRGRGDSFCAGLDFATAMKDPKRVATTFVPRPWRGTNTFQEACWAWRRLPMPVIAAVHGHCFGGGLQIALAADYRFTTADAQWSVMEVKWGLIPDMTGVQSLKQLVGIDVAKRLTMTGEVVSGADAVHLGLASEVADDPYAAALALAAKIAQRSPDSVASAKALFEATWSSSPRRTFAGERWAQLRLLRTPNTAVARAAARARELPAFADRSRR